MNHEYISQPATEPITIEKVKAFLKVEHTVDDGLIADLISEKREYVEVYLSRTLLERNMRLVYSDSMRVYRTPIVPVIEVIDVTYDNGDNPETTIPAANVQLRRGQACIIIEDSIMPNRVGGSDIIIQIKTGYASIDLIPKTIINALMLLVADEYNHRCNREIKKGTKTAAMDMLEPHRNQRLF